MPTNFHKDLPDSQLHNPKGFSDANKNSICIKNESSVLSWKTANYTTTTTIQCVADISKNLAARGFYICSDNDTTKYHVWFDVDNVVDSSFSVSAGYTSLEVNVSENDTASTVATALKVALAGVGFSAGASTDTVTISNVQTATNPSNIDTDFTFISTRTQTANEHLATDSSGNIIWTTQPAIKSLHQFSAIVAPKNSGAVNIYHADGLQGHDNKSLSSSVGSSTMPTTVSSLKAPLQSVMFLPANVMSYKIHYTVYHTDSSTRNVNFKFAETKLITGVDTSQSLVTVATIADSVPSGETVTKDVSCTSSISDNKALILYGAAPTTRQYYIYGVLELTIT